MFEGVLLQSFYIIAIVSGVPLLAASAVGLLLSLFQAVTQIQDQATVYAVKIATVSLLLYFLWPWFSHEILEYTQQMFRVMQEVGAWK